MLAKPFRLRARRDFKRVYQRGRSAALPCLVLYWRRSGAQTPRLGFSVSKKLGKAVQRNAIKRRLRSVARELLPMAPPGHDFVFVARSAAAKADYARLKAEMTQLLAKAGGK